MYFLHSRGFPILAKRRRLITHTATERFIFKKTLTLASVQVTKDGHGVKYGGHVVTADLCVKK